MLIHAVMNSFFTVCQEGIILIFNRQTACLDIRAIDLLLRSHGGDVNIINVDMAPAAGGVIDNLDVALRTDVI